MSEAKPKRKFWQFHFSTAIVMMLLASILVAPIIADLMTPDAWRDFDDKGNFNDPAPGIGIIFAIILSGLIVVSGCVLEWLIRRREACKI
jgi:hypothetical protein